MFRLALIAAFFWYGAAQADTYRLELDGGECAYKASGQGEWWLGTYFTSENSAPRCGRLALSKLIGESWGWRLAYANLGRYEFIEYAGGAPTGPDPHWTGIGYGVVQGVSLGVFKDYRIIGPLSLTGEAGGLLYDSYRKAYAYHWASEVIRDVQTPHKQGIAPYVGGGVSYALTKSVSVSFTMQRYFRVSANREDKAPESNDQIGWKNANVTAKMLGVSVAF